MTKNEFSQWLAAHQAVFTWLIDRLNKFDDATRCEVLQNWFDVLKSVKLEYALRATKEMNLGDVDRPRFFDDHPLAVRHQAIRFSRFDASKCVDRFNQREPRYRCKWCQDMGVVEVWHDQAVEWTRQTLMQSEVLPKTIYEALSEFPLKFKFHGSTIKLRSGYLSQAASCCPCRAKPEWIERGCCDDGWSVYDETKDFRYGLFGDFDIKRLLEQIAEHDAHSIDKYAEDLI